jgi:hypothetical protein
LCRRRRAQGQYRRGCPPGQCCRLGQRLNIKTKPRRS